MAPPPAADLASLLEGDPWTRFALRTGSSAIEVFVEGELDGVASPRLGAIVDALLAAGRRRLVIDLAGASYLGVSAVRSFGQARDRARAAGGDLTLRGPSPLAQRVLEIMAMTDLLEPADPPSTRSNGDAVVEAVPPSPSPRALVHAARGLGFDATLSPVTALTCAAVAGANGASVTLTHQGAMATVAASDETVEQMDRDQYATGEGPCLAAASLGRVFHVESVVDDDRWPSFMERARQGPISSILSSPLVIDGGPVGALNIYSTTPDAFDPAALELATLLAGHASLLLAASMAGPADDGSVERLRRALVSREIIAQAQGAVMARHQASPEEAYAVLRRASRRERVSVLDVAAGVLERISSPVVDEASP